MPNTRSHRACAGRAVQTGETFQQAFEALGRLSPEAPPIPDPAGEDQAFLESWFLESIGRCDVDRWRPRMLPFAVRSVTPLPAELIVRVPLEFLPDILRQVMPFWSIDEEEDGHPEVYGIAGLRGLHERGRLVLTRPGFPGRISIPGTSSQWRKAALVAADTCGDPGDLRMPWLDPAYQADWHPAETRFVQSWQDKFIAGGPQHGSSLVASQFLRRLPGLCPRPRAVFHSLWINHRPGDCAIQFEWENGPAHPAILARLLDPVFGLGMRIEVLDGQTLEDCYSAEARFVWVRSRTHPGTRVALRRMVWVDAAATTEPNCLTAYRGTHRAAVEARHSYWTTRRRPPA